MDTTLWAGIAILTGPGAIIVGFFVGKGKDMSATLVPGIMPQLPDCASACAQLESARQAKCLADAALAAANNRVATLNPQVIAAVSFAGVLWGAVIAAAAIPIVGHGVALALAIIASVASALAAYLAGQLLAALQNQSALQSTDTKALQAVIDARNVVLKNCKGQDLTDCLNRPSPCG
jgi:hypothetical protein